MSIESFGMQLFDQSGWALLKVSGPDRVKTINNICTQDIKKLNPGDVSEAFITNLQGKTCGFVSLFNVDDALWLRTNPGGLEQAMPVIQKYSIFDDSVVEELTESLDQCLIVVCGESSSILEDRLKITLPKSDDFTLKIDLGDMKNVIAVKDRTTSRFGLLLIGPKGLNELVLNQLKSEPAIVTAFSPESHWNEQRLRHGWPLFGKDIKPDQLPQEVDRDKTAISFHKGCYLGQETVARLDALGHVNRLLVGFIWEAGPNAGSRNEGPLEVLNPENQNVGEIRSLAFDKKKNNWFGLALVRTKAMALPLHVKDDPAGKITFHRLEEYQRKMAND